MFRVPPEIIEQIRARVNLIELIGAQVKLHRSGKNLKGLCPFHAEKTPSFFVNPDTQMFYCFGCNKGGDIFTFVMMREGLSYGDAIKHLAETVGIRLETRELKPEEKAMEAERAALFEAHTQSALFYQKMLNEYEATPARQYLAERKLTQDTIAKFQIGFAPQGNKLSQYLIKQGFSSDILAKAGLVSVQENKISDRFWNRIIVPIYNTHAQVVAFGGRVVGKGEPKYLNSSETPIFHKGKVLFGLNVAKTSISSLNKAILVEGYLDVISLHQAGLSNVVAPLGTGLTVDQIRLIRRYTDSLHLLFDGDQAGRNATVRAIDLLLKEDFPEIKVIPLPEDKDPDDMVRSQGLAGIKPSIDNAIPAIDFIITQVTARMNPNDPDSRVKALKELLPFIQMIKSAARRSAYVNQIAKQLAISEQAILDELPDKSAQSSQQTSKKEQPAPIRKPKTQIERTEEMLLWLMLNRPDTAKRVFVLLSWEDFQNQEARLLAYAIFQCLLRDVPVSFTTLQSHIESESVAELLARLAFSQYWLLDIEQVNTEKNITDCIQTMLFRKKHREFQELHAAVQNKNQTPISDEAENKLLEEGLRRARERSQFLEQNGRDST